MESDINVKSINTNAKNLKWYNWTLIIFQSLILSYLIFLIIEAILFPDEVLSARDGIKYIIQLSLVTIVALTIWQRSAYSMLKSRLTLTYNNNVILSFQTAVMTFYTPIYFSDIKSLIRKSSVSIEFAFNRPMANDHVFYTMLNRPSLPAEFAILNGNEKELDMFCEDLKKLGINTTTDSTLYEDPQKFKAMVIIIFTIFFLVFAAVLKLAPTPAR